MTSENKPNNNNNLKKPEDYFFRVSANDFKKIPGSPIAYWVSESLRNIFLEKLRCKSQFAIKAGISTGLNETFILLWSEVSFENIKLGNKGDFVYTPHNKGGEFRKWMGNCDYILKYSNANLEKMMKNIGFRHDGKEYYYQTHIGWSKITSSKSSFRFYPEGFTFDSAGLALFNKDLDLLYDVMGFLNSKVATKLINILNPTLNVTPQIIKKLPFQIGDKVSRQVQYQLKNNAKNDWDSYETSWDFTELPILQHLHKSESKSLLISESYKQIRQNWQTMTFETQRLEEENNRIFIEAYDLENELTPDVPLKEITLTCNPRYRYKKKNQKENSKVNDEYTDQELEQKLLADTMKEFISYAVGCMLGRYSIDKQGLILANQGEGLEEYLEKIETNTPTFNIDEENVLPILDSEWFSDDIVGRFKQFLKVTFGDTNFIENLEFIEKAIGKNIRKYFLKDFYNHHVKMYKNRPIYWLFSSPKGSFNALIYMHRYKPDTVSIILNKYLREYIAKLNMLNRDNEQLKISTTSSDKQIIQAGKDIDKTNKIIHELNAYENDILYPLATERRTIDLDDGVKGNYPSFGKALKQISGL